MMNRYHVQVRVYFILQVEVDADTELEAASIAELKASEQEGVGLQEVRATDVELVRIAHLGV